jgi:cyclopropane fatty-acyl-phospholipid synthase-like methyltransferase
MAETQQHSKDEIKTYYDNFLDRLKRDHERENPRHTYVKKALKGFIREGMKVLDIGCGTGITSAFMGEIGAEVTGVDISDKMIEFAREKSAHLPNVTYIVEDITKLSLDKKFDAITIIDSFEHIPADEFWNFLDVISEHSFTDTIVYLNIPDSRYQRYMMVNYPDKLQIIDEDYNSEYLIEGFKRFRFQVYQYSIYGLDVPAQYNEYLFVTSERLEEIYRQGLKRVGLFDRK